MSSHSIPSNLIRMLLILSLIAVFWGCRSDEDRRDDRTASETVASGDSEARSLPDPKSEDAQPAIEEAAEAEQRSALMSVVAKLLGSDELGGDLTPDEVLAVIPEITNLIMGLSNGSMDPTDLLPMVEDLLGDQLGSVELGNWVDLLDSYAKGDLSKVDPAEFLTAISGVLVSSGFPGGANGFSPDVVVEIQAIIQGVADGNFDAAGIDTLVQDLSAQFGNQLPLGNLLQLVPFLIQMIQGFQSP